MTPEEESAEAQRLSDEEESGRLAQIEADKTAEAERSAAEEAEKNKPPALNSEQIAALVRETQINSRLEWEAEQERQRRASTEDDKEAERLADLRLSDPVAAEKESIRIAQERAEANLEAKFEERYGGRIRSTETDKAIGALSDGLGAKGKEFIQQYAPQIAPEDLAGPAGQILKRAAKDYERENTTQREAVERSNDVPPPIEAEDKRLSSVFAQITAAATGIDEKTLALSDDELRSPMAQLETI